MLNATAPQIGALAASLGIELHELTPQQGSLEEAFLALTRGELEYEASEAPAGGAEGRR